jgi:putative monooxygenase
MKVHGVIESATTFPEPVHSRPADRVIGHVRAVDVPGDTRRGGELRVLLSPRTCGATCAFLGVATVPPGGRIAEHYHPYSDEFLYVIEGDLVVDLDGEPHPLHKDEALLIPPGTRHRLRNPHATEARCVFSLSPLAPRPELGHVDTETAQGKATQE